MMNANPQSVQEEPIEDEPIEEDKTMVDSWVLPMVRYSVLLPQVSVVEVVPWVQPIITAKNLTWYLGAFPWRNISVPLISFDVLNGGHHSGVKASSRVAILNTCGLSSKYAYMAWIVQGEPSSLALTAEAMQENKEVELGDFEAFAVEVDDDIAVIPKFREVEEALLSYLGDVGSSLTEI